MADSLDQLFAGLRAELTSRVVGRTAIIERMLTAILADGHILIEGPPGLAKTRLAFLFADAFGGPFQRIQFTPDLLPSDLTGSVVYDAGHHQFDFHPGPLFNSFILADEINRAPAKVQAALLEAMEERHITVGGETRPLSDPFFVVATQNPIEEEGTYELPAAQLDRFVMRFIVGYPDRATEKEIIDIVQREQQRGGGHTPAEGIANRITADQLRTARASVLTVHLSEPIRDYIVRLVVATRGDNGLYDELTRHIAHPVSPRGSLSLARLGQARAWLHNRDYVVPEDIQALLGSTLAHRIRLTHRAVAEGMSVEPILDKLLDRVPVV